MPFDAECPAKSRDLIVLEKARERIAQGWCRWDLNDGGAVCLLGALGYFTTDTDGDFHPPCGAAERAIEHLGFGSRVRAFEWNDEQTSKAPVLARFDAAIERLSAGDGRMVPDDNYDGGEP